MMYRELVVLWSKCKAGSLKREALCINCWLGPFCSILGSQWSSDCGIARDGLQNSHLQAHGLKKKKKQGVSSAVT